MKISNKIGISTLTFFLGFIIITGINRNALTNNELRLQEIKSIYFPTVESATVATGIIKQIDQNLQAAVTLAEEEYIDNAKSLHEDLNVAFARIKEVNIAQREQVTVLENNAESYVSQGTKLAQGMIDETIDFDEITPLGRSLEQARVDLVKNLANFVENSKGSFDEVINDSLNSSNSAKSMSIWMGIVVVVLALGVNVWSIRSIVSSLKIVSASLKDIAQGNGDLTERISYKGRDEIGELVSWFNTFIEKLQNNIKSIHESTDVLVSVTSSLKQSSSSTQKLIQVQQESILSSSSAIELMKERVQEVVSHSDSASTEANNANETAQSGQSTVSSTLKEVSELAEEVKMTAEIIQDLNQHTSNVGEILETIQSIAEQTNLLALNAAIEAARAGEQGRGFAVVAEEVRTLASRTQLSTQEIQEVLEKLRDSSKSAVDAIFRGSDKADQTQQQSQKASESLQEITLNAQSIMEINQRIASTTSDQVRASDSLENSVSEIESASKNVTENSEEMDKSINYITEVSEKLQTVLNQFKV
ncbi:methyl-accepting chemotaxis protein [Vibrio profundum]|uniref:methyl-accepting chemotaxis protein n=1 Tax=Vibrio profundum TaxID=2910247 RepID=UPI003D100F54